MASEIKVLDFGYVKLVESWGSDSSIIEAARMSTNKGFLGWGGEEFYLCPCCGIDFEKWELSDSQPPKCPLGTIMELKVTPPGDEKLLRYLYTHKHMTPFEMAGLIVEVQAPIFVFREWHRHRTQSYNEMSARYIPIPDANYLPTEDRIGLNIGKTENRQAMGIFQGDSLQRFGADWLQRVEELYKEIENVYQDGLNMGVPKELARIVLPVGRYSRMRASANLRNWLQFLTLRLDASAQWEIRQYAEAVAGFVEARFPRTFELFKEGG